MDGILVVKDALRKTEASAAPGERLVILFMVKREFGQVPP